MTRLARTVALRGRPRLGQLGGERWGVGKEGVGCCRGGAGAAHLQEQLYFFSVPPTALPGGIRISRTQQVSRTRRWLPSIRSISVPASRSLSSQWGRPAHLRALSSMIPYLQVTSVDSQSMPAGPSQGWLNRRWGLSPEVGPWSTSHVDPPHLSRELQESEGEGYPALER